MDPRTRSALRIAVALLATAAAASAPALPTGVELPALAGTALSGEAVSLPRAAQGHPALIVVGFSKVAAKITRPWVERCRALASRTTEPGLYCYDVRMVEEVPRMFRGTMERGMRKGLPVELQHRALLVYSDNEAWHSRISVVDDDSAYVIGCDKEGRVQATAMGAVSDAEIERVLASTRPAPASPPAGH